MRNIYKYLLALLVLGSTSSCYDGIDPITYVDPGPDAGAPVITIVKPTQGFEIQVPEPVTSINIEFKAEDDIELESVTVSLDGSEIASYDNFVDYRIAIKEFTYDNIETGDHVLSVNATDISGNTSVSMVNFSKQPPYTPLFSGEMFYMSFDGSFTNLVTVTDATEVGSPGFSTEAVLGSSSYAGAADSYLTYPTEGMLGSEFSASFWMKVNGTPDRAGILVIGPPDEANPTAQNNRTGGFRLFREAAAGMQRFKLNVGNGTGDSWFDGGAAADVIPDTGEWTHIAFTISGTQCVVYVNGQIVSQGAFAGVDWTGCDIMSIMSGAPRFSEWGHNSDLSNMDELRLFNIELTQNDITAMIAKSSQKFKMSFDGSFTESLSKTDATEVGNPGFAGESFKGINAYAGSTDSYLTFPTDGLLSPEFSATMWYKLNADPDRAGILVIGPPDEVNPTAQNNRISGFRFFREAAAGMQRFKLNVGNGAGDSWFDGGAAADVDPAVNDWVHLAFTISGTECVVYINGQVVSQGPFTGVDWAGCDILSIMSGAPRFSEWGHNSDLSFMDELALYDKALTQEEIQALIATN